MAFRARGIALGAGALALAAAIACSGTTANDTIIPITGITVRSETLTTGRGCGTAPGQVFKYVAVVTGLSQLPAAGAVSDPRNVDEFDDTLTAAEYDCFTDATFVQLPANRNSFLYRFDVYAYEQASYANAGTTIHDAVFGAENAFTQPGATHSRDVRKKLASTGANWTTTCSATQQQDVDVLAVCDPVQNGLAGIAGETNVGVSDGGAEAGGADAGDDGAADAADAADAGDADGG